MSPRRGVARLGLLVLVVVGAGWTARELDVARYLQRDGMRHLLETYDPYGPLLFVGLCAAGVCLRLPGIVLVWLGGVVFGVGRGFVYGWAGCLVGAAATFLLVRHLARDPVQRLVTDRFGRLRALDERLARHGVSTVLALRLALFMAPTLNWTLGATRVRFRHYLAGTAVGVMPAVGVTAYLADASASHGSVAPATVAAVALCVAAWLATAAAVGRRLLGGRASRA
jgi:uncharacterized membrane protein YdjX (TVP38/TMEM64 family)